MLKLEMPIALTSPFSTSSSMHWWGREGRGGEGRGGEGRGGEGRGGEGRGGEGREGEGRGGEGRGGEGRGMEKKGDHLDKISVQFQMTNFPSLCHAIWVTSQLIILGNIM